MGEEIVRSTVPDEDVDGFDNAEDVGGHAETLKPWDPGKIRITTKSFTLREVMGQIEDDDIDLSPDFQREYVWKDRQRTRLIESILLGIPLPAFYFNQSESGRYQVVDGVQRLSTIALFMRNGHRLSASDLEYLYDLDGMLYEQLDTAAIRRFRSTQIVVHIIEPQTPDEVKYDIFNRVNTLGSPLSAQEIRHAMSAIRSREFIRRLAESDAFDAATEHHYWKKSPGGAVVRDSGRMANRELVLRFCAFRASSIEEYRQFASLDAFLMNFTKRIDGAVETAISDQALEHLEDAFLRAMVAAKQVLGIAAFRRWPLGADRRGPINRAVFEAQANALADHPLDAMLQRREEIIAAFRSAFVEQEYLRAVTVSTGDPNRVSYRLQQTRNILADALR
ncbi:DUF262 domain-containing protein [Aureimonas altamirensis]|uniref:DUF262 domain-containing protein n=1 Tax=Aureimonas altamirensis TaxID=370622 RepID=UPI002036EE66|nr:DUF262 domain-containing protein [Aureimonas altamirensis]MCM2505425.1 DUF262 domain-containing protein [Aureimonas altamirensis]